MSKRKEPKEPVLRCPECGTDMVIVREVRSVMANTFEHYCHSVKAHDSNAEAACLDCSWTGERKDLIAAAPGAGTLGYRVAEAIRALEVSR